MFGNPPAPGSDRLWPAEQIAKFIQDLGYSRVVAKSDQEATIRGLIGNIKTFGIEVIPELSPVGDKGANGVAEQTVQAVEGQLRVLKFALERRLITPSSVG